MLDACTECSRFQVIFEAFHVESELLSNCFNQFRAERRLVFIKRIMHLPELALGSSGFRGLGGKFCLRVNLGERKVAEYEAQSRAELVLKLSDHHICARAIR